MPNGIDLILADHRMVDELFADFSDGGDGSVVLRVVDALTAHDEAEQGALYPFALAVLGTKATKIFARSALAHSAVKKQIEELKHLEGAPLAAAFKALQKLVQAHVKDEEANLLPALGEAATTQQLDILGSRILQAKQRGG